MSPSDIKEIKIGFSCFKKWPNLSGTDKERYCESCNKTVYNFSELSDQEIIEFLSNRNGQKTCGKFTKYQIASINQSLKSTQFPSVYKPFILSASMTALVACGTSKKTINTNREHGGSNVEIITELLNPDSINTILIEGFIYDEINKPLIGANFFLLESKIGCTTDLDGKFKLLIKQEDIKSENASVQYFGYAPLEIPLVEIKNKEIKISMVVNTALLGEVVIIKQPLYKRLWNGFVGIFK